MREFQCRSCGHKQYSSARLEDQSNPNCRYCGATASEIFETTATADTSNLGNKASTVTSAVCEAAPTGTPTIDQAIIAAHIIKSYCQEVPKCSRGDICPLGHMINCYETESCGFGPDSWDVPDPEEIGLCGDDDPEIMAATFVESPPDVASIEEAIELLERGDYNVKKRTN